MDCYTDSNKKVPVTILTGFLGSGKTTFLRHILVEQSERKVAVIQNEFGESIGIEEAVVMGSGGENSEWLELPNGCVCCSVRGDLVLTVEGLLERRKDLDNVIIETTGLADPGSVAGCFWLDNELESQLFLDSILTIIDAKHIQNHLSGKSGSGSEARRQIAFGDQIIVNKTDLVTKEYLLSLEKDIKLINPTASLLYSSYSKVPVNDVLGVGAFTTSSKPQWLESYGKNTTHTHEEKEEKEVLGHQSVVSTCAICVEERLDEDKLTRWLGGWMWRQEDEDDLAKQYGGEIYRVKGVVYTKESEFAHWLQGVGTLFEVDETNQPIQNAETPSKIVVIGSSLNEDALNKTFTEIVTSKEGGD
uniref:CobW C-terminal domain-containing protein n=1 Tax=Paramoeba aestuarina TaxID=180227 RepID=A0A7S4KQ15_9EUKA|eukprot:CAMPEP_0201510542 /NCGR_PEP_ID=MMETSP0161_2-20130828/3189_1 /ASSEMBLY_ACC=CAM_ASM_000251 /TAXON_ID=180227 /ORGANISM="Neoparamoeba aestuarina, Strain SoJaBio B1-5/56/2" /LENGTH=360 /DNA_ID=CAMNT_0047905731 /DNA_START=37 /DNA_END=1119 /DNA_ORIENTATION=-